MKRAAFLAGVVRNLVLFLSFYPYLYPERKPYSSSMKKKNYLFLALGLLCFGALSAQVRREFLLEKDWKFTRTDDSLAIRPDYDDAAWQSVTVPHDWAIYGPFNPNNDKQNVAIVQDGQVEPSEHAGRTGGLPFVGTGWYRTRFSVPEVAGGSGKRVTLQYGMLNLPHKRNPRIDL